MDKREIRQQQRNMKSSNNHIDQEIKRLEFQKNKLLGQIKALSNKGAGKSQISPLVRQVGQINGQLEKLKQFSGKMTAMNYKIGNAATMNTMANAMGSAGNAMKTTNQNLDEKKIKDIGINIQKQNMKLDMKSDMMEDALDFGDDLENDEEVNDIYNQVLQEAGFNAEKFIPNSNKSNVEPNQMYMKKQKVAAEMGNQGNYNMNYNNNNFNRNNNNYNYNYNIQNNPFANPFGNSNPYEKK